MLEGFVGDPFPTVLARYACFWLFCCHGLPYEGFNDSRDICLWVYGVAVSTRLSQIARLVSAWSHLYLNSLGPQ